MRKYIIALALLAMAGSATLQAQTAKQTAHINYVLKNMKLDNATKEGQQGTEGKIQGSR